MKKILFVEGCGFCPFFDSSKESHWVEYPKTGYLCVANRDILFTQESFQSGTLSDIHPNCPHKDGLEIQFGPNKKQEFFVNKSIAPE